MPPRGRRIGLVGCVREKALTGCAARDLYLSHLFVGRRAFVEASCTEWWILSAKHGLVDPKEHLRPYNVTLKTKGRGDRRRWSQRVLAQIDERIRPGTGDVCEVHAGAEYRDFGLVVDGRILGCRVENPTAGMGIGKQLRFYMRARG